MRWADVCHQDRAVSILRRALASGRTHHAYLFAGPEGVGKELTARVLVARLLCLADGLAADGDACGACVSCRTLASGNHPDFHLIHRRLHKVHSDPAVRRKKGLGLGIEVIREFLLTPATLKPSQSRRRVFLIREAELMNEHAENALLKTLEEPPGAACLILLTTSASRLLATIRSRCQQVPFDLLPQAYVAQEFVRRLGLASDEALSLARLCGGRLGVGLRWHAAGLLAAVTAVGAAVADATQERPEVFAKRLLAVATELGAALQQQVEVEQGDTAVELTPEGEDEAEESTPDSEERTGSRKGGEKTSTDVLRSGFKLVLALVAAVYRDGLCTAAGAAELRVLPGLVELSGRLAEGSKERLQQVIEGVNETELMVDRNVAPQLACERLGVVLRGEAQVPSV